MTVSASCSCQKQPACGDLVAEASRAQRSQRALGSAFPGRSGPPPPPCDGSWPGRPRQPVSEPCRPSRLQTRPQLPDGVPSPRQGPAAEPVQHTGSNFSTFSLAVSSQGRGPTARAAASCQVSQGAKHTRSGAECPVLNFRPRKGARTTLGGHRRPPQEPPRPRGPPHPGSRGRSTWLRLPPHTPSGAQTTTCGDAGPVYPPHTRSGVLLSISRRPDETVRE